MIPDTRYITIYMKYTNVDRGSGHHGSKHLQEVVLPVTKDLNSGHAFDFVQGCSHSRFPKF